MKTRSLLIFTLLFVLFISTACGSAQVAQEPTATPIPGWTKYEGSGIAMYFPESWSGGDPAKEDLDVITNQLKALGSEYEQIASMIEENPTAFALWLFDGNLGDTGYLTNANVVKEQVVSAITIDTYVEALSKQLPSSMVITDQKTVKVNKYDAARLEITANISGIDAKELMYIVKDGNTIWGITFATALDEFDGRVPDFEKIASTFTVQE